MDKNQTSKAKNKSMMNQYLKSESGWSQGGS